MDVGGWGYRLGRSGAAIVVRRGQALMLAEAAAVVNAYVAMR